MSTERNDRTEALDALLLHPGWHLFLEHCHREWGPNGAKYNAELDKALDLIDPAAAASQARQIRAGRKTLETLLSWPAEELARVKRTEPEPVQPSYVRGGYGR